MKLNNANLADLPAAVKTPSYDRSQLTAGIVHIGLGNFHRAHQSWYLHQLMEQGVAHDWAIVGAGVRPYDANMRAKMAEQDYLTTLIQLDPKSVSAEVVGSMIDYVEIQEGNAALIERMAQSDIRIVALTVTEGGYFIDPATQSFDPKHPDIVHDGENPDTPRTAFGAIIAALKLRRARGLGPFTGQSCDNILGNGNVLRQTIVSLARLSDVELAIWIDENCSFPNSMVDCIVPATGENELALAKEFGVDDAAPVTHEQFRQWVIEDDFCAGRPDWDKAGATFSDKVHDYETMKIRVLNGGHQIISAAGDLLGVATIEGCMTQPQIAAMFDKIQETEIKPFVCGVPEFTPEAYVELIRSRFSNPRIVDTTRRVAFDGSSRQPGFIIPNIHKGLDAGRDVSGLALVSAIWARYCAGSREDGSMIEANDPFWDDLTVLAARSKSDPKQWLSMRHIYGDLADDARFVKPFTTWLNMIYEKGTVATIDAYLAA